MLNFTVGPVMSPETVLRVSSDSSPYFRTSAFSKVVLDSERMMLDLCCAPLGSRCVFLTASGTGAMEAAVINVLEPSERVIVLNGGTFGQRFVDLCRLHHHEVDEVRLSFGSQVTKEQLSDAASHGATALLVNMHETSSGLLYDMALIASFCHEHGLVLIVDAVSSFIADCLDMGTMGADVVLTGSQKALACHPGMSIVVLSERAQRRVWSNPEQCLYLSFKEALKDGERGQTPWTPAVTTLLEIRERLAEITERGIESERSAIAKRAACVREATNTMGLCLVAENPSNAVSAFRCPKHNAGEIVRVAQQEYGMWLCPNGGPLADEVFRIGHIGDIHDADNQVLVNALFDMHRRGII